MKKTDDMFWTQLFQDKLISPETIEKFQKELMVNILANPVDFGAEIRFEQRRKWGIVLAACLILSGVALAVFFWLGSNMIYQMLSESQRILFELPFVGPLLQVWERIVQNLLLLNELKMELSIFWNVISWPLMGILAVIVVYKRLNPLHQQKNLI